MASFEMVMLRIRVADMGSSLLAIFVIPLHITFFGPFVRFPLGRIASEYRKEGHNYVEWSDPSYYFPLHFLASALFIIEMQCGEYSLC